MKILYQNKIAVLTEPKDDSIIRLGVSKDFPTSGGLSYFVDDNRLTNNNKDGAGATLLLYHLEQQRIVAAMGSTLDMIEKALKD